MLGTCQPGKVHLADGLREVFGSGTAWALEVSQSDYLCHGKRTKHG
jgi:hypothetical protein